MSGNPQKLVHTARAPDFIWSGRAEPAKANQRLREEYLRALAAHVAAPAAQGLDVAFELGLKASRQGLGMPQLAAIHHLAAFAILERETRPKKRNGATPPLKEPFQAMADFFASSLRPIWDAQRQWLRKNCALIRMNEVREEEARRIAHALHDETVQLLAAVHLAVEEVARELESPYRERLQAVRVLLDRAEAELRNLSHELRPVVLDDLGLATALELLAEAVSKRSGTRMTVSASLSSQLPALIETTVYRIVQECLNNCIRYARGTGAGITVEQTSQTILCRVKDDGVGFDVADVLSRKGGCGLGLKGIRERIDALGGTLSIQSAHGRGTEVTALIPLNVEALTACSAQA